MTKQYVISFCYRKYSVQYELSGKKATSSGTSWSKNVTFHQIQLQECSKIWPCCWGSFRRVWIISHYSRLVFTPSSTRVTLLLHISPFVLNIIDGNQVWRQTWSVSNKQLSDRPGVIWPYEIHTDWQHQYNGAPHTTLHYLINLHKYVQLVSILKLDLKNSAETKNNNIFL